MRLNFTNHKAKADLGSIGKTGKTVQYALIQHSVLMLTGRNEPLGLLDVDYFNYSDIDTSIERSKRKIEEITLHLKAISITFPVPEDLQASIKEKGYTSINLNVVMAYNEEHEWIVLTNLPIETIEQIKEIVTIYKSRWHNGQIRLELSQFG
jgi:hypothetical protein